eukprot:s3377_g3.t1
MESSMATPQQDTEMEEPQPPLPSMGATPLFQPIPVERDASFTMAAAQVGVDINSDADLQAYLATPLTTRAQVLDTIRHYHVGVIRPEVFNLISQVEQDYSFKTGRNFQHLFLDWRMAFDKEWICRTSLSELLFRFFSFYAQAFSWGAEVVSIREHLRTCMQQAFLTINSNAVPQVFLEAGVLEFHEEGEEMAQMLPYPAVRPAQVSRLNARSKPFQAPAELPSRTIEMRFEESRANAIEDSKIRAMTEPRITVTDGSASKTATPGIKAMEEAKDQKTEQKQSAQEPAAGAMSTALAWLNGGDAQEEEPETQPVPVESSVPWTRLAGGRVEI